MQEQTTNVCLSLWTEYRRMRRDLNELILEEEIKKIIFCVIQSETEVSRRNLIWFTYKTSIYIGTRHRYFLLHILLILQ